MPPYFDADTPMAYFRQAIADASFFHYGDISIRH
jgi:hypothetical protein